MMAPLYAKANSPYYHPKLSDREIRTLLWWTMALPSMGERRLNELSDRADFTIFTDAATSSSAIAAVTLERLDFTTHEFVWETGQAVTGPYWLNVFKDTSLIYGLETLALLALLWAPNDHLRGKSVTFHIDNENTVKAVIKCNAKPTVITAMTHLIWHRIRQLDITPWFEWVPSNRNIADLPTRGVDLPFPSRKHTKFTNLRTLHGVILEAKASIEAGRPAPLPRVL